VQVFSPLSFSLFSLDLKHLGPILQVSGIPCQFNYKRSKDLPVAVWLQWWTEANSQQPNKELWKYLGVYTLLFGLSLLGIVAGCWWVRFVVLLQWQKELTDARVFLVKIITTTGLSLHRDLLQTTLA
jgi:hypothetical protein